jgi:glucokinase
VKVLPKEGRAHGNARAGGQNFRSPAHLMNTAASHTVVLAGDIGGTNARLRIARARGGAFAVVAERAYRVADFSGLEHALDAFIAHAREVAPAPLEIERACFAIAGPVDDGRAKLTNAAWTMEARAIGERFGITSVRLVNDFHAAAAGIGDVPPSALFVLQQGVEVARGPRLVIGAGTGLGVAYAIASGDRYRVVPGEGGHVGFAPADDEQIELARFLRPMLGRVSAEHVVSGPGIVRLYAFALGGTSAVPDDVACDGAAAVARRADAGETQALRALGLFASILGAVAGDHALSVLATGGVYIAGGIAAKLATHLRSGGFVAAFNAKGVHSALMARMPVRIVLDERLGLAGASRIALEEQ